MKALVIGYGSIGSLHAKVLKENNCEVRILSQQKDIPFKTYKSLEEVFKFYNPNYIIIANKTSNHYETLSHLIKKNYNDKILIEKPLFNKPEDINFRNLENIYIGYNLRFHPIMQKLKSLLVNKIVISVNIYVGQYLPNWRKNIDYRKSYSAKKVDGGGVLRDLSHEIDYALWFFGPWEKMTSHGGQLSKLQIDTDDIYTILLKSKLCPIISIQMSYLDRIKKRQILINTDSDHYEVDLINNYIIINGKKEQIPVEENESYRKMHSAVLGNMTEDLCTIGEGLSILNLIKEAEKVNGKEWSVNE